MSNVAVVGPGYWGPNLLRNLYELHRSDRLIACDLDQNKLNRVKSRYPVVETTPKFSDILQDDQIDAVVIATPVSYHYSLAKQALEAGKHIFVEKPFTVSRAEAIELIDLGEIYYFSSSRVNLGLHQKDVSVIWDLAPHRQGPLVYHL